jgi:hypothetical protein
LRQPSLIRKRVADYTGDSVNLSIDGIGDIEGVFLHVIRDGGQLEGGPLAAALRLSKTERLPCPGSAGRRSS